MDGLEPSTAVPYHIISVLQTALVFGTNNPSAHASCSCRFRDRHSVLHYPAVFSFNVLDILSFQLFINWFQSIRNNDLQSSQFIKAHLFPFLHLCLDVHQFRIHYHK